MSIRMHLAVGYGLDLSAFPNLDKERLDWDILEDEALFSEWRRSVREFASREGETMEGLIFHERMNPPSSLVDLQIYNEEFGDPDKLLLMPSGSRDTWHRYGNLLDAFVYEAQKQTVSELLLESEWLPHPGTLYPYIGLMKENPDKPLGIEKYWVSCYLDHEEHKDAIAWAPWHLWFWIRTVFELKDDDATRIFLSLRPTVYRYFS